MEVIRVAKKEKRDVLIPHKFLSIFETLAKQGKDKQATELIIAIIRFDMTGEEPTISDDGVAFVWESVIRPQLEENIQKYKEVSKARSEAVGNRYKQDNTSDTNEYNCNNSNQKNEKNTIVTDYDVDVDIDCCHSCYLFYYCITNIVKTMNLVNKNCTFLCKISFTKAKNLS